MRSRPWITAFLGTILGLIAPVRAGDFVPLIKGDDVKALELVGIVAETITFADGEIRVSGKPNGYFATRERYQNYTLKFEWMYERPDNLESEARFRGNSGLLVHIQEPHKVWPRCIEVQLMNADAGAILPLGGTRCKTRKDAAAQKQAIKPVGQWNQEEVTCKNGTLACTINGIEVSSGTDATIESGPIGWQSEGTPIRLRNLMIKPLD